MQYFLCPRCKFKVPTNRRVCQTCGYELPKTAPSVSESETGSVSKKGSVWARVLGYSQQGGKTAEAHEKPALS